MQYPLNIVDSSRTKNTFHIIMNLINNLANRKSHWSSVDRPPGRSQIQIVKVLRFFLFAMLVI